MNAIVKMENTALATMDEGELMSVLQSSLYPGANVNSIKMVLGYCKAAGLDPMQKPVHIVPMWDKNSKSMRDVIMPGVGLYRTNAARTNQLAGISEPEFGPDMVVGGITVPEWCRVTVKRLTGGKECSFTAREYWAENYATASKDTDAPNAMWRKRPRGQIAKCAQAQALRMAFPEATGAAPTADEMEGKMIDTELSEPKNMGMAEEVTPKTLPAYPADKFAANLPAWHKSIADGKATAEKIIAKLRTVGTLTQEQVDAITPKPAAPAVTYAQVADAMAKAQDVDALDEVASLIGEVADPEQRAELMAKYEAAKAGFDFDSITQ